MLEVDVGPARRRMLEDGESLDPECLVDAKRADQAPAPPDHLDLAGAQLHQLRVVVGDDAV